jgi:hypothetical protein
MQTDSAIKYIIHLTSHIHYPLLVYFIRSGVLCPTEEKIETLGRYFDSIPL